MRSLRILSLGLSLSLVRCANSVGPGGDAQVDHASIDVVSLDVAQTLIDAQDVVWHSTPVRDSDIGNPCTGPGGCRAVSNPLAALDPGACINWENGYCTDFCSLPAVPVSAPRLVRADCPQGAVCLPRWYSVPSEGERNDVGACLKECTADSDCRASEGYYCRREFYVGQDRVTLENGYCAPMHCRTRGCPQSFRCGC